MKYWKIIFYTGEGEFETREMIINDKEYKQVQKVLAQGGDLIILKDKPTVKRTSIASIIEADREINEYRDEGIIVDGVLENPKKPKMLERRARSIVKEEEIKRIINRIKNKILK